MTDNKTTITNYLERVWSKTINPNNPHLKFTSKYNALLEGLTRIGGYLDACKEFDIIDQNTYDALWNKYIRECTVEGFKKK